MAARGQEADVNGDRARKLQRDLESTRRDAEGMLQVGGACLSCCRSSSSVHFFYVCVPNCNMLTRFMYPLLVVFGSQKSHPCLLGEKPPETCGWCTFGESEGKLCEKRKPYSSSCEVSPAVDRCSHGCWVFLAYHAAGGARYPPPPPPLPNTRGTLIFLQNKVFLCV